MHKPQTLPHQQHISLVFSAAPTRYSLTQRHRATPQAHLLHAAVAAALTAAHTCWQAVIAPLTPCQQQPISPAQQQAVASPPPPRTARWNCQCQQ